MKMFFMHENNNELLEDFSVTSTWMKHFENYKYKCLSCHSSAIVRKYEERSLFRIFSIFNNKGLFRYRALHISTFHLCVKFNGSKIYFLFFLFFFLFIERINLQAGIHNGINSYKVFTKF